MVQRTWVAVSPALSIRMGHVYLCVPLGSALMAIHLVGQGVATARQLFIRKDTKRWESS
jgi:TRAP-type C4-dicarboxylate transport system permease small subunit